MLMRRGIKIKAKKGLLGASAERFSEHTEVANIGGSLLKNTERMFELLKAVKFGIILKEELNSEIEDIKKKLRCCYMRGVCARNIRILWVPAQIFGN
jgi:hypothetical protein